MRLAVIGAGIVGVTTAYELAQDGHDVTVFERRGAVAEEASFANAGVIAPGYTSPWSSPGMPAKVFRHLLSAHAPVKLRSPLGAAEWSWALRWLAACKPAVYAQNRARMLRLALYSKQRLHQVRAALQLEYDSGQGYLILLRNEVDRQLALKNLPFLKDAGVAYRELGPDATRGVEPALSPDAEFVGSIHLPDDEAGNCRQFAHLLRAEAQALGVQFEFGVRVAPLDPARAATLQLFGPDGSSPTEKRFDQIVVCAGVNATQLLEPLGLRIPLVPIYGYSISAPVREPLNAPRNAVMDERYKVAITRLGQRVRVAGSAELGGRLNVKSPAAIRTLYKVLHDWFPGAASLSGDRATVQEWKGARPMLPDGPPLICPIGTHSVWLNIGHGSSGWALACGSARVLADLISARSPEIAIEGFSLDRLGRVR